MSHEIEEAKQVGRSVGREIGRERIRQGVIRYYIDEAREALADGPAEATLSDAIRMISERLKGDVATLEPGDCDAIDEALDDAGLCPGAAEIRREARVAAADACDEDVAGALEQVAVDYDAAGVAADNRTELVL